MRRMLPLLLASVIVACAPGRQPPRPAPTPTPANQPAVTAPTPPAVAVAPRAPRRRTLVRDTASDNAALDSLSDVAPSEALPDLPIATGPTWDLNVTDFADQPRVKYFLDYFTTTAHDRFQIWLERMPRFEAFARDELTSHGLPGDLVYLALIESGFSATAVSRASAVGMWQFMAATGKGYGLHVDSWVDERRDPIRATDAAARHLADLTERFGSPYLAAAAYNAGAGRVERGLNRIGAKVGPDADPGDSSADDAFFSLADTRLLKVETRDYVPKLIAAALIAKEPGRYGFDPVDSTDPFPLDSVLVDGGTGLDLIAQLADTSLDALRELNPNLLRMVTPPGTDYAVRVPTGTADKVAARYADLEPDARHAIAIHPVRSGETLASVAKYYGVPAASIQEANRLSGSRLPAGRSLVIPLTTGIPLSALREPVYGTTVVVRRGDTVGGLAQRYHVSVASIRAANHLSSRLVIRVGQKLRIPSGG